MLAQRVARAAMARGKALYDLGRWCDRKDLPGWGALFRAQSLRGRPDDARARKELGYKRGGDGWTWPADAREQFRSAAYVRAEEPQELTKLRSRKRAMAVKRLVTIASAAKRPVDADDDARSAYADVERCAWQRVIDLDPTHEKACKALGFVEFDGRLVDPAAQPFLEERIARAERVRALGARPMDTVSDGDNGRVRRVTCGVFAVDGDLGQKGLQHIAKALARAHIGFVDALGLGDPDDFIPNPWLFVVANTRAEFARSLIHYGELSEAQAKAMAAAGDGIVANDAAILFSTDPTPALERAIGFLCLHGVRAFRIDEQAHQPSLEVREELWISDALAMDITIGLTGARSLAARGAAASTSADWLTQARLQLEVGDDPAMGELVECARDAMGVREVAKSYAFMQYLLDRDPSGAASFYAAALAVGGEAAAKQVFSEELSALDDSYGAWARLTIGR